VETRGRTSVENLAVSWPGAEIRGSAELDADERLLALALDPLRLAGTDLRLNGSREGDVLTLRVAGPRLDLAPFLAAEDGGGGGAGDAAGSGLAALAPLRLDLAIDHMVAGGDGALRNVTGGARIDDIGVHDVRLDAGIRPGEGEARLRLEPADEGGERLSLTTDDAGGLLAALALTDALRGGTLELSGDLTSQLPNVRLDGEITARDFVLGGAPPVVRVLAAAPATAELAEDDLAVARFTSPLVIDGDTVRLDDALMIASNLAVRASGEVDLAAERVDIGGSLAPVQGVNRFIGNLPLIGALLQGSSKAGAFALSFSVQGPWADPAVSVNPLSVVTPGLLQDLFAGAEIKPPRIPEDEE
jgi:hypothetical protein